MDGGSVPHSDGDGHAALLSRVARRAAARMIRW